MEIAAAVLAPVDRLDRPALGDGEADRAARLVEHPRVHGKAHPVGPCAQNVLERGEAAIGAAVAARDMKLERGSRRAANGEVVAFEPN